MMATTHPLAEEYLERLERSARALPRRERDELLAEIRDHLASGLPPHPTEADVRNLLEDLGSPEDIVAAAAPERLPTRRGAREVFALILLVTGMPPILGWLAGVGLLLWSPLWSTRQKLLGILVWPGGYIAVLGAVSVSVGASRDCSTPAVGPSGIPIGCTQSGLSVWTVVLSVVVVLAPIAVAAYLYRAAGRRAEAC